MSKKSGQSSKDAKEASMRTPGESELYSMGGYVISLVKQQDGALNLGIFRELYNSCYSLMNWIQQVRILKYLFCLVSTCERTESKDGMVQMAVPPVNFAHF